MATTYGMTGFDIGRVFERTFRGIAANGLPLALIALITAGLPRAILDIVQSQFSGMRSPAFTPVFAQTLGALVAVGAGYYLCVLIGCAAMIPIALAGIERRRAHVGAAIGQAFMRLPLLILLTLVTGIGVVTGLALLIVPGIILGVMWAVAVPVMMIERRGVFGSIGRSAALTKGSRWAVFAVLVLLWIVLVVGGGLVGGGAGAAMAGPRTATALPVVIKVLGAMWASAAATFTNAFYAALYAELRDTKEGGEQTLDEIFA